MADTRGRRKKNNEEKSNDQMRILELEERDRVNQRRLEEMQLSMSFAQENQHVIERLQRKDEENRREIRQLQIQQTLLQDGGDMNAEEYRRLDDIELLVKQQAQYRQRIKDLEAVVTNQAKMLSAQFVLMTQKQLNDIPAALKTSTPPPVAVANPPELLQNAMGLGDVEIEEKNAGIGDRWGGAHQPDTNVGLRTRSLFLNPTLQQRSVGGLL